MAGALVLLALSLAHAPVTSRYVQTDASLVITHATEREIDDVLRFRALPAPLAVSSEWVAACDASVETCGYDASCLARELTRRRKRKA